MQIHCTVARRIRATCYNRGISLELTIVLMHSKYTIFRSLLYWFVQPKKYELGSTLQDTPSGCNSSSFMNSCKACTSSQQTTGARLCEVYITSTPVGLAIHGLECDKFIEVHDNLGVLMASMGQDVYEAGTEAIHV